MRLKTIASGSLILLAAASVWSEHPCGGTVESVPVDGPYQVNAIAVNNSRMVTADRDFTLTGWDLRDPDSPTVAGRWTLWDEAYDSNNRVLLDRRGFAYEKRAWQFYDEYTLRIWDLRDPANPVPAADTPGADRVRNRKHHQNRRGRGSGGTLGPGSTVGQKSRCRSAYRNDAGSLLGALNSKGALRPSMIFASRL